MNQKPKLNKSDFYAQFPRHEEHEDAAENYERPDWHTLMEGVPEQHTRNVVKFRQGGMVHPASRIHGVHIVTSKMGEPVFTGKL